MAREHKAAPRALWTARRLADGNNLANGADMNGLKYQLTQLPAMVIAGAALGSLLLCLALPVEAASQGGRLYRYINAQGLVEISHAVPPSRVAQGYEVLDAGTGRVIETIAAQLSPEQLAVKRERDRTVEVCRQNIERVSSLYGSAEDIERARQQTRQSLETRITNLASGVTLEERRLEDSQRDAAQRERTGRAVTEDLLTSIDRSKAQIRALQAEIVQRRQEQEAEEQRFDEDRRLFEQGDCPAPADSG